MNALRDIKIGDKGTESLVVTRELTVQHFISSMPAVYGTPMMIFLMEVACGNAITPALPEGWVSVGTKVDIKHLAATPIGRTVVATGIVTAINDREVMFSVSAHDGVRLIGEGTHARGVVNREKFESRLEKDQTAT